MIKAISIRSELSQKKHRDIEKLVHENEAKLYNFIRKSVTEAEAEDILQDVFYQLTEAYQLMKPIENTSAWLYRVARNKITDLFRKKKPDYVDMRENCDSESTPYFLSVINTTYPGQDDEMLRQYLFDEIEKALEELPESQKEVFVAHEIDGLSFKEISIKTGESINTLLSRKRYAILTLRNRLKDAYSELLD